MLKKSLGFIGGFGFGTIIGYGIVPYINTCASLFVEMSLGPPVEPSRMCIAITRITGVTAFDTTVGLYVALATGLIAGLICLALVSFKYNLINCHESLKLSSKEIFAFTLKFFKSHEGCIRPPAGATHFV